MSNIQEVKKITEDQFHEDYSPVQNHIDKNASFGGCMFETYGEEFNFIINQDPKYVWTIIENDDGELIYTNGFHSVNRFGYFLCEKPSDLSIAIETEVDDD